MSNVSGSIALNTFDASLAYSVAAKVFDPAFILILLFAIEVLLSFLVIPLFLSQDEALDTTIDIQDKINKNEYLIVCLLILSSVLSFF